MLKKQAQTNWNYTWNSCMNKQNWTNTVITSTPHIVALIILYCIKGCIYIKTFHCPKWPTVAILQWWWWHWPSPEMKRRCWTPWRTESANVKLTKALMLRWSTRDNQESYWDCRGSDGKVSGGEGEAEWHEKYRCQLKRRGGEGVANVSWN